MQYTPVKFLSADAGQIPEYQSDVFYWQRIPNIGETVRINNVDDWLVTDVILIPEDVDSRTMSTEDYSAIVHCSKKT